MKKKHTLIGVLWGVVFLILFTEAYFSQSTPVFDEKNLHTSPTRIISLSPQNTEILFALGAGDRVVGVTNYCDFPPEALKKEKIGDFIKIDLEKIISLSPDLVIANSSLQENNIKELRQVGIPVLIVQNETMDELLFSIERISIVIGAPENGRLLHNSLQEKMEFSLSKIPGDRAPRIFIEVWDHPLLTVGNKAYLHDLITKAGGINVAGNTPRDYYPWDIEKLYASDPDIYLRLRGTDMGSKAEKLPREIQELRAIKEKRVITLFGNAFIRSSPRSFDALDELVKVLYSKE